MKNIEVKNERQKVRDKVLGLMQQADRRQHYCRQQPSVGIAGGAL